MILTAVGLATALALLELLLRLLPVSSATMMGYYVDPDILTYPPRHRWTVSGGWSLLFPQKIESNNWGFSSRHDFIPNSEAIGLIGDSYVEALMLDADKRPSEQLAQLLGGKRPVYGLGIIGTAMLDYAQRIRFAHEKFAIRDFVIWLEAGDARQALCGSGNVHSRCLNRDTLLPQIERLAQPSLAKRIGRHMALVHYFVGQLQPKPEAIMAKTFSRMSVPSDARVTEAAPKAAPEMSSTDVDRSRAVVDAVVDRFFAEVRPYARGRLLFLVDGLRHARSERRGLLDIERRYLIERLRINGAEVIDLEPVYATHVAGSALSLEVGQGDHHLNALGVRLVMTRAARALGATEPKSVSESSVVR